MCDKRHVHHDGNVTWREEEKNGFSITAENKQLGPCTQISYPNPFDVAVFPENESADPYLFLIITTDMSSFYPLRQNNTIRTNHTLAPTPSATDPTIPTLLITRACSAALRFAFE
jgi:hypothetical protein